MRIKELQTIVDVEELLILEMQKVIQEENILLESDIENKNLFLNFINQEMQYISSKENLTVEKEYFPISYNGAPVGKLVIFQISVHPLLYKSHNEKTIFFEKGTKEYNFPMRNHNLDGGIIGTMVFDSVKEQEEFLNILKLKFGDWRLKFNYVQ